MRYGYSLAFSCLVLTTLLLVSCGGSGAGSSDVFPGASPVDSVITGPNSFLLFPNPQVQPDGSFQTNTTAYAQAYYDAIDPNNDKDTLTKWKTANGFGNTATGTETTVVFGDVKDLGYGRRITARQNADGTAAVMVENYLVSAATNYAYSSLNLDAAVVRDQRWHVGTNGIEFSGSPCTASDPPIGAGGCDPSVSFAKFYTFDPVTGQRKLTAELDGRGEKAMPGICITCHGGRGDPLTPAIGSPTGKTLFPLVAFSASQKRGDVQAHLQPLDVDSFDFSATSGYTRADQEAAMKTINQMVLRSYPIPAATVFPEDANRRLASGNEWQGTAAVIIKNAYGGEGLPNAAFSDTYAGDGLPLPGALPTTSWATNGELTLYKDVIAPSCRACHILRGTGPQSDINFDTFATTGITGSDFLGYAESIKSHIVDRGNMPLAKIVFDKYYSTDKADTMATFLNSLGFVVRDSSGVVLKPGRPVADPGPGRVVQQGNTNLTAAGSLYATTYAWSITTNAGDGALTNPNTVTPTFSASVDGTYVLQLVVGNGATLSDPAPLTIVVDHTLPYAPTAIRFADIKTVLQGTCVTCHTPSHPLNFGPPIYYTNIDRNGDGNIDSTDDDWFYTELRGRINFTDIDDSPLLRKPSNYHHAGGLQTGFDTTLAPGSAGRANYDLFLNWILNGALNH